MFRKTERWACSVIDPDGSSFLSGRVGGERRARFKCREVFGASTVAKRIASDLQGLPSLPGSDHHTNAPTRHVHSAVGSCASACGASVTCARLHVVARVLWT